MNSMLAEPTAAVKTDSLLAPYWADIVEIVPEAEGIVTIWLRFLDQTLKRLFPIR